MEPSKKIQTLNTKLQEDVTEKLPIPTTKSPKKRLNFADTASFDGSTQKKKTKKKETTNKLQVSNSDDDCDYVPIEGANKKKMSSFDNRIFSESEEISILQGMIDFRKERGFDPSSDFKSFLSYLHQKQLLGLHIQRNQLKDKTHRLKTKFHKTTAPPHPSEIHTCKLFHLSNIIWGQGEQPDLPRVDVCVPNITISNADDVNEMSLEKKDVGDHDDRNHVGDLKLSSDVVEVLKDVIRLEERYKDFGDKYPYLNQAVESEGGKLLLVQKWSSIAVEELEEMEAEFKKVAAMELKARRLAAQAINNLHLKWLSD